VSPGPSASPRAFDIGLLRSRLRRVAQLPPREILTTLHAVTVLAVVEMLIRWVSLPRLSWLLGIRVNFAPVRSDVEQFRIDQLTSRDQRQLRCTRRVADAWPLSKGPCLRRSLVAGHLLRHHHPAIRLGVAGRGDEVLAHAWLEIDDRPLERIAGLNVFQRAPTGTSG
jgi:hypothetical protein